MKISIRKSFFLGIVLHAQQIEGKYAKIGVFFMKIAHNYKALCFHPTAENICVGNFSKHLENWKCSLLHIWFFMKR